MTLAPTRRPSLCILGSSGRLGSLLQRVWQQERSVNLCWLGGRTVQADGLPSADASRDPANLANRMRGCDVVLVLAGPTAGTAAVLSDHAKIARTVLAAAEQANVGHVILLSSAAVYGDQKGPLSETTATAPVSDYGRAKVDLERVAVAWTGKTSVIVLRLGNVVGADGLIGRMGQGHPVRLDLFPSGSAPQRSMIGIESLGSVLLRLAQLMADGVQVPSPLNIAAPGLIGMDDLLNSAGADWSGVPAPATAILQVHLDNKLLETLHRFEARESTAKDMIDQWQRNRT